MSNLSYCIETDMMWLEAGNANLKASKGEARESGEEAEFPHHGNINPHS